VNGPKLAVEGVTASGVGYVDAIQVVVASVSDLASVVNTDDDLLPTTWKFVTQLLVTEPGMGVQPPRCVGAGNHTSIGGDGGVVAFELVSAVAVASLLQGVSACESSS